MSQLKVYTLFSSSKGNSILISGNNTNILIDAGQSLRSLTSAINTIGYDLTDINSIFITHAHSDHISSLPTLLKHHKIPVHMTEETANFFLDKNPLCSNKVVIHPREYQFEIDDFLISSFCTSHDIDGSVGYICKTTDDSIGIITDTGYIPKDALEQLKNCNRVIIESNYDKELLKQGSYPIYLKKRIDSKIGHLSNNDCADAICYLANSGVSKFMLAHLSEENNTKEKALFTSCELLQKNNLQEKAAIMVADRYYPTFFE